MSDSNFWEDAVINYTLRGTAMPALTNGLFIGLKTANPTDANSGGTEPTIGTNGYARVQVTRIAGNWSVPADNAGSQRSTNAIVITFPESTGAWATGTPLTHFIAMDAATGGNLVFHGALGTSRVVDATGIILTFAVGQLAYQRD